MSSVSPDARDPALQPATRAIRAGRDASGASLAPALWASSVWESSSLDDAHRRATATRADEFYGRYGNPTVRSFEQAVADLEGAEDALAFASGMGAIASTVLALCSTGDHIVAAKQLYAGTLAFLQGPCARFGIEVTLVDGTEPGAFTAAVIPGRTTLVIAETPSNPRLELCDLDALGSIMAPFTVVDSTFATPLGQQPLAHGVDLVLHSATKGIAGHNDATLGVIAGERELVDAVWSYAVLHGAMASPFDALNALRGIRTLGVRTNHQAATALQLGEWLSEHPVVTAVHYPGLVSHPQHDLAKRQMRQFGTVLAFEVDGGVAAATAFLEAVRLPAVAPSLGGVESLVTRPAATSHRTLAPAERAAMGISDELIRVSTGIEGTDDLVADFLRAMDASS